MHRRDLLRLLGATAALPFLPRSAEAAIALGHQVHAGSETGAKVLRADQLALLDAVCELIIPRTDTPGALDAKVPAFIDHMLAGWYPAAERDQLLAGFKAIDSAAAGASSGAERGSSFAKLGKEQQVALLTRLDGGKGPAGSAEWALRRIKSLTVYGYFSSELVVKTVTKDPIIPGRFDGCAPVR
jgi:gluconate 2-dehydrogenase gamma chain